MATAIKRFLEFEAHHRAALALCFAGATFVISSPWLRIPVAAILSWNAFALCSLTLAWAGMMFIDAKTCLRKAHLQDSSRAAICAFMVLAALAGLFGSGMLLASAKNLAGSEFGLNLALAGVTVLFSWLLVHTILALHYAHVCCHIGEKSKKEPPDLGVVFPREPKPDFLDFAYFSFVIGMTCQVSDVQITSRRIRRLALMHGLLSFSFNTVILVITLNLASGLF